MNPDVYTIKQIAGILSGELLSDSSLESAQLKHLLTDSRNVVNAESSLFFAIKGDRRDGHEFINDMYQNGVRNFVITKKEYAKNHGNANFIIVENSLLALQKVAAHHRNNVSFPVIGITGSNGKTIVKEWLFQLLRSDHHVVRSPKSYNSQIGVPLSVWQITPSDNLGIFEAGISRTGEMNLLEQIIKPTIGIFTNIGEAHAENFTTVEEKVQEKLQLFKNCDDLIYCKDYSPIHDTICKSESFFDHVKLFTWSRKSKANLQIGRISKNVNDTTIQGIYNNNFISVRIPFCDDASIENAIHCWAFMLMIGYEHSVIEKRMELLSPVAMRLEMKEGVNNCSIINDSYNSDLGSLTIALDFMNQQNQHEGKTIILSDILQSGKNDASLYSEVASLIKEKGINKLIGVGEHISKQAILFDLDKKFYKNTDDLLRDIEPGSFHNETILVKGARLFGFERITKILQQKAHETVLEINLNALVHNLNFYRSRLHTDTKVMAMVKALSYGTGSFEIANTLQFHHVDYLAVAYADEGVELRKAGITAPIMVMSPEEQSFDSMVSYQLEPEIYSFRTLQLFSDAAKRQLNDKDTTRLPIHIKLDTGMRRLGFEESDINKLVVRIKNLKHLKVVSVFTHLASSDNPAHDNFTRGQCEKFKVMADSICGHFNRKIFRHALNSAGIIRFPEFQFDMVRLGIGLHGIAATPNEQNQLNFVSTLKTSIAQIKTVRNENSVGYGLRGVVSRDTQIATVSIGYADGLDRRLGNGVGKMVVNGIICNTVGNICMDMCMIDISGVDAKAGDEVVVFGPEYTIVDMAKDLDTIPYEILTSVSFRVKRVYFHE
jgi:Alr-MurF fusion protein